MKDPKNPTGFYRDVAPWMIDEKTPPLHIAHGEGYDVDPKTGKISQEHQEECCGCSLCEGEK